MIVDNSNYFQPVIKNKNYIQEWIKGNIKLTKKFYLMEILLRSLMFFMI